jgi:hypothetical protein
MKKTFSIVAITLLTVAMLAFRAEKSPKVIGVIMKASWCTVCNANGPRLGMEVMPTFKDNEAIQFLPYDLSDEKTREESKALLTKSGVYESVAKENQTGEILLVDVNTKKILKRISVAEKSDKVIAEIKSVL